MSLVPHSRAGLAVAASLLATGALSTTASAQAPAPAPGVVSAIGTASVKPVPEDATSNASILAAVRKAKRDAIPQAVADARNRAQLLAAAGDLKLGALISIEDGSAASPFFYSSYGQDGTFGPGKFCGLVTRYRTTRLASGAVRRTRIGQTRRCRVPTQVTATETVTFATAS